MKIARYYKDRVYIGVKHQSCDPFGVWRKEITANRWQGRPRNRYEHDETYEYTDERWKDLIALARKQAKDSNRDAMVGDDYIYLVPVWIHVKMEQETSVTNAKQANSAKAQQEDKK